MEKLYPKNKKSRGLSPRDFLFLVTRAGLEPYL
jgi:hypothetical protein